METIKPTEIYRIISSEIPEVKSEVNKLSDHNNVAAVLQIVVSFIRKILLRRQLIKASRCIALVGKIYGKGNAKVRDIIENLFVRSFNGMKRMCVPADWRLLQSRIPLNLQSVYLLQNKNMR